MAATHHSGGYVYCKGLRRQVGVFGTTRSRNSFSCKFANLAYSAYSAYVPTPARHYGGQGRFFSLLEVNKFGEFSRTSHWTTPFSAKPPDSPGVCSTKEGSCPVVAGGCTSEDDLIH